MNAGRVKVYSVLTGRPRMIEAHRDIVTCGHCGRAWDDSIPTHLTPAPAARCPFEYSHVYRKPRLPAVHASRLFPSGAWELSTIAGGRRVAHVFYQYTKREALQLFRAELRKGQQ